MKRWMALGLIVLGTVATIHEVAEAQGDRCSVEILSPVMNARVGEASNVSGSATIPAGTKLWIFAHRKGLALWWPQGGGFAQIDNDKQWTVLVFFGVERDIGSQFEITARVVEPTENRELEAWVRRSVETRQYPGIPMPRAVPSCLVNNGTNVIVTRDH
ncbi:MAG: hypothetical protein AB7H71_02610 [Alphaproteobacteria bacterium]